VWTQHGPKRFPNRGGNRTHDLSGVSGTSSPLDHTVVLVVLFGSISRYTEFVICASGLYIMSTTVLVGLVYRAAAVLLLCEFIPRLYASLLSHTQRLACVCKMSHLMAT
jgi:hypothetical protein